MSELIIYTSDNLRSWAEQQMVWLKQLEDTLNRLEVIFLETAEQRTKRREAVPMRFWRLNMNQVHKEQRFSIADPRWQSQPHTNGAHYYSALP